MPRILLTISLFALTVPAYPQGEQPKPGYAKKDGLSLTVSLDKKSYGPGDDVILRYTLRNETDKVLFLGDGYLAPHYTEAGPGKHFEVHVKADGKTRLLFWSGLGVEGFTAGIRKVYKLKPGEQYKGSIRLSSGPEKVKQHTDLDDRLGGTFEDKQTHKAHILGKDARKYAVELLYQVEANWAVSPKPAEFKDELLWKGRLISAPLEFEVVYK